jgi:GAF domain-containing protein
MLVEGERDLGEGPSTAARLNNGRVVVTDVLSEARWPRYAPLAARWGVRSVLTVPVRVEPALLVVGLYSVRPGAFSPQAAQALADMLTEQVGVAMANLWDFEEARTDAAQLQEALAGRSVIDQAKGIIMQTSGCTAEAAFEELRRISQHHQVKVADLARLLVEEHQRKSRR